MPNAFSVGPDSRFRFPGLSLRSNPGLKLANAFGVILLKNFKLMHYRHKSYESHGKRQKG